MELPVFVLVFEIGFPSPYSYSIEAGLLIVIIARRNSYEAELSARVLFSGHNWRENEHQGLG